MDAWTTTDTGLIVPDRGLYLPTDSRDGEDVCELCGCSTFDACYEGEPWAAPGLCASCAEESGL